MNKIYDDMPEWMEAVRKGEVPEPQFRQPAGGITCCVCKKTFTESGDDKLSSYLFRKEHGLFIDNLTLKELDESGKWVCDKCKGTPIISVFTVERIDCSDDMLHAYITYTGDSCHFHYEKCPTCGHEYFVDDTEKWLLDNKKM